MACRWASEDPNPAAKTADVSHLVKLGEAGIARGLDPNFVQAVREMDELEGLVPARTEEDDEEPVTEEEGVERAPKRARIEPPTTQTQPPLPVEPAPAPAPPMGLLSANALDSLRYVASLRQETGGRKAVVVKKAPVSGLGSLADYGSDED